MHVVSAYSGVAVKKIDYRWAYRRHTYSSVWLDDRISGIRSMDCFILSSREFALSARTQVFLWGRTNTPSASCTVPMYQIT